MAADATTTPPEPCTVCRRLTEQKAQAREQGDLSRETDCIVLFRRHELLVHSERT